MKNHLRKAFTITLAAVVLVFTSGHAVQAQKRGKPVVLAVPGQVIMRVAPGMGAADAQRLAADAGCHVLGAIAYSPGYYLLATNDTPATTPTTKPIIDEKPVSDAVTTAVSKMTATAGVLADPNYVAHLSRISHTRRRQQATGNQPKVTPNDTRYGEQWNMNLVNMPQAWAIQLGTKAVLVADIDSGLDITHPDLQGTFVNPMNFLNPTVPTADVTDAVGHGTATAGVFIAQTNNATGIASVAGWNRNGVNVKVIPVKAANNLGGLSYASVIASLNYAVAQGAGVINCSFSGAGNSATEAAAVANAISKGAVVVASSGNDGTTTPNYPASFPGVISVSSVGPTGTLSSFSTYGGNVAITAPGGEFTADVSSEILLTVPVAGSSDFANSSNTGTAETTYGHGNGTSFSAPHVTGAVALLLAAGAPASDIRSALQFTATVLDETPNFNGGNKYGAGLLNVAGAVALYTTPSARLLNPDAGNASPTLGTGGEVNDRGTTFNKQVPISLQLRAANRITDPTTVTVDIIQVASAGSTVSKTQHFVGGTDFTIPTVTTADPVIITVPKPGVTFTPLADGQYKIVATVVTNGVTSSDTQFVKVVSRTQPLGRQMFSLPYVASQAGKTPEVTTFGSASFQLFRWDPTAGGYALWSSTGQTQSALSSFTIPALSDGRVVSYDTSNPTVSVSPAGIGYWLDLAQNQTLNLTGNTLVNPVGISLVGPSNGNPGGWNMIGDPYPFAVNWGTVSVEVSGKRYSITDAVNNGYIRGSLIGYSGTDYVYSIAPDGQLQPFNGYWVQARQNCNLIIAPAQSRSVTPTRSLAAQSLGNGWQARISASIAGDVDGQNYFGQVNGAETSKDKDKYDIPKPPSGAGHAYLRFVQSVGGRSVAFARDMRSLQTAGKQEWLTAVTSDRSDANVTLAWEGINAAPRRSRLYLTDLTSGAKMAMKSRSSYTFRSGDAGTTRQFKITLESAPSAGSLAILNLNVTPTRGVRSGYAVHFTTNQDATIVGTVKRIDGKVIANLNGSSRAVGASDTSLNWDGKANGVAVPSGLYKLEITARTEDGQTATVSRPFSTVQ